MALFIQKNDNRSELQKRLAAELSEKAKARAKLENEPKPTDGVDDSAYIEGTKKTTSLAWVWLLIALAVVVIAVVLVFQVNK